MNKFLISYFLLLAVSISGCGGGGKLTEASTTPTTPVLATTEFVALASAASCANLRNRMFVIDQKQVFWDKAGSCADASFDLVLFGSAAKTVLCSLSDSIAGPKTTCNDEQFRTMFLTMTKNLDKADLGLGSAHQVQQLVVPPGASTALAFSALAPHLYYGTAPANIVIKDATAWAKFLEDGKIRKEDGANLSVDFSNQMVLGVFFKTANNCSISQILKLRSNGQKLIVDYTDQERISAQSCDPGSNLASTPMSLVVVNRFDLPVEFVNVNAAKIGINVLDVKANSGVQLAQNLVVKDVATWTTLWTQHDNNVGAAVPVIDFSKRMVVAIFLGSKSSGCYAIKDVTIWRSGGKLNVAHLDRVPGSLELCTATMTAPAYLVELDRTDDAVEFTGIATFY